MTNKTIISKAHNVVLRKKKINNGYSLYLDINYNGIRTKEYLRMYLTGDKNTDKKTVLIAEEIQSKRIIELRNTKHGKKDYFENASVIAYAEILSENSVNIRNAIVPLKKYIHPSTDLSFKMITLDFVTNYKIFLIENYSNNTGMIYFNTLKSIIRTAIKEGIISDSIIFHAQGIKKKATNKSYLELHEIKQLEATPHSKKKELQLAFLFSCFTGLRLSDLMKLKWSDIRDDVIYYTQKKTKEPNKVPLSMQAKKYLPEKTDDYIFHGIQYNHKYIIAWAKKAGLSKHISFHTARHTFITLGLSSGVDIFVMSKLAGHTDIKTTMVYANVIDERLVEGINKLPTF